MSSEMGNQRVLIVDDNPECREILVVALSEAGYAVEQADGAEEAVGKAASWKPSLVVMDYRMPVHTGIEAMYLVRQVLPQVPVIIVSGSGEVGPVCFRAGAQDFVPKPYSVDDVVARVRRCLDVFDPR